MKGVKMEKVREYRSVEEYIKAKPNRLIFDGELFYNTSKEESKKTASKLDEYRKYPGDNLVADYIIRKNIKFTPEEEEVVGELLDIIDKRIDYWLEAVPYRSEEVYPYVESLDIQLDDFIGELIMNRDFPEEVLNSIKDKIENADKGKGKIKARRRLGPGEYIPIPDEEKEHYKSILREVVKKVQDPGVSFEEALEIIRDRVENSHIKDYAKRQIVYKSSHQPNKEKLIQYLYNSILYLEGEKVFNSSQPYYTRVSTRTSSKIPRRIEAAVKTNADDFDKEIKTLSDKGFSWTDIVDYVRYTYGFKQDLIQRASQIIKGTTSKSLRKMVYASKKDAQEDIETLGWKVLETGQKARDRRGISDALYSLASKKQLYKVLSNDPAFALQVERDQSANYKFYDALCMWMGQAEYWDSETNKFLEDIARKYIEETEREKRTAEEKRKTAKIKATYRKGGKSFYKTFGQVYEEAKETFRKELEENPNLDGLLQHNIEEAMKNWDSTQEYYFISL